MSHMSTINSQPSIRQLILRRKAVGLSQGELAAKAKIALSTIFQAERGRHAPRARTLIAWQEAVERAEAGDRPPFLDQASIRSRRMQLGVKLVVLAEKAGLHHMTLSRIESMERTPKRKTIAKIINGFETCERERAELLALRQRRRQAMVTLAEVANHAGVSITSVEKMEAGRFLRKSVAARIRAAYATLLAAPPTRLSGKEIRHLRESLRITRAKFAKHAMIDVRTLSEIENEQRAPISRTLKKIMTAMHRLSASREGCTPMTPDQLRQERVALGFTMREVARHVGVVPDTVSKAESGRIVRLRTLRAIEDVLRRARAGSLRRPNCEKRLYPAQCRKPKPKSGRIGTRETAQTYKICAEEWASVDSSGRVLKRELQLLKVQRRIGKDVVPDISTMRLYARRFNNDPKKYLKRLES